MMAMVLTFEEAEFIATLFDATKKQMKIQFANMDDFITAQSFLGNEIDAEPDELKQHYRMVSNDIDSLRERIRENYGI